jgi:hypothetical protein
MARISAASVRRAQLKKKKAPVLKAAPPVRSVTIEPLDPWLMCGPDTSVRELWRVKEVVGGMRVFHLVFFDKYGWYCEHGRECRAVTDVRRLMKELGVR